MADNPKLVQFTPTPLQRRVAAMVDRTPDDGHKNVAERLLDLLINLALQVLETIDKSEMSGVEATKDDLKALPRILDELIAEIGPRRGREHLVYWKLAELILAMQCMPVPVAEIKRAEMSYNRALKKAVAATPEALAAKATTKAKELERLVPIVLDACALAGRNPAASDPCVKEIRPYLPKKEQGLSFGKLKEALGVAGLPQKKKKPPAMRG